MIDLHTHTLLSDGELLPSELVRRAEVKGYTAIALTDHADRSNIDFIVPRLVEVAKALNHYWKIRTMPGVEITHVPLEEIKPLVRYARRLGAKIVVVHGETVAEPVITGTNRCAIEAGCDILAHPGLITVADIALAVRRGVLLEITTRQGHAAPNRRLIGLARKKGARLVLNNDAHCDENLFTRDKATAFLKHLGCRAKEIEDIYDNALRVVKRINI